MKSTLISSAYRILATAAIVFATFVAVFFMFNASLSSAGASFFNAAEASTSEAGGFNLDHSWGGGSIGFPYGSFVYGCTDDAATNYDPDADINDRSCIFPPVEGCTDPFATNYDFKADKDDDSCEYPEVEVTSCDLTASAEIIATGGSVTLTWETEGYEEFTLNGQSISDANGNKTFTNVLEDTTYTFVATNSNGDRCQATVTVQCLPPVVPTCESFNITQSTVVPNANLTFNWNTNNATNVSIDNGIGAVTVDGTNEIFQAPAAEGTYTYTLTFDGKTNNSCVDTVKVEKLEVHKCELDVKKTVDKSTANVGEEVTYTITVKNIGTADCTGGGVKIYDVVDTNLAYKSHTFTSNFSAGYGGSPVYTPSDRTLRFNGNVLTPNEAGTIVWTGTVKNPTQCGDFVVKNQAKATAKELNNFNTWVYSQIVKTTIDNDCVVVHPTCDSFSITQSTVAPEANLTFNWSTTNVSNVSINNGIDAVAVDGTNEIFQAPAAEGTYTYTLTFDGKTNNSCVDTVKVEKPVVDAPVCLEFAANPATFVKGEQTTLTWVVENAVTLGLNNGIGDVTGTTTYGPISPIESTVYKLDVFGADGTKDQCEAPVTVTNPTDPAISIVKRDAIDKDDTQAVAIGGTANFEIVVTNTGDEDLVNVVVTDALESACNETIGALAVGSSTTYTCNSTNVQSAFTNVAAVTGDSAVDAQTVTDTDPTDVTIKNTAVFTCAENVSFTASDTSIDRGDSSRLAWNVTDADSVAISGISATGLTGTEDVSPSSDTTYVLTATKSGFNPIDCNVRIDVSSGGGGGGGSSSPRCELEISDNRIDRGDEITLTWDSSRARELILTDDRGNTIVTTEDRLSDDKEELFDGEITLTPTRDTEYTLRVERGSRDRECTVDVEVEDDEIVLLETRDQAPLVAGISLTEVPYTGFEAGTVMTFLFYALLAAWALYITYVLVIPKTLLSAAPQLVTPQNSADHMTSAESMRPDAFAALSTASVATSTAAKAAAPANLPVATAEPVAAVEEETVVDTATGVENQAHLHQALLSSSAVQSLIAMTTDADRSETLTKVIADAKGAYPLEDGWVVINQTRLTELTTQPAATPTPTPTPTVTALTGNGSLAEAVVTGNVVAAYELIGTRPMFALADASADLDTLYRNRKGANEPVSDLLTAATKDMTDVQIADMIAALTGALDGTYTDEASAVKMAIMKAVKIAA